MEPLFQCGNGIYLFCGPECVAVLVNFIHDTFPCLDLCGLQGVRAPDPPGVWTTQFKSLERVGTSHLNPLASLSAQVCFSWPEMQVSKVCRNKHG